MGVRYVVDELLDEGGLRGVGTGGDQEFFDGAEAEWGGGRGGRGRGGREGGEVLFIANVMEEGEEGYDCGVGSWGRGGGLNGGEDLA